VTKTFFPLEPRSPLGMAYGALEAHHWMAFGKMVKM